jgi:hemerythrin
MIEWRVEMAVGVPSIDEDHKVLISIINEFECCQTLTCAENTAKKLFNYTKSHFKREEMLLESFHYTGADTHHRGHDHITNKLKSIINGAFIKRDRPDDIIISEITELMRTWVLNHVIGHDLKMKPFFKKAMGNKSDESSIPTLVKLAEVYALHP